MEPRRTWFEHCVGGGLPLAADGHPDVEELRGPLLRGELVGDGPPRRPPSAPQTALLAHAVHLHDHAVDVVVQVPASRLAVGYELSDLGHRVRRPDLWIDWEAEFGQQAERFGLRAQRRSIAHDLADLVAPDGQASRSSRRGVLLAQRSCGCVARVGVPRLARCLLGGVQRVERLPRHVDLAPHLDHLRAPLGELVRNAGDGEDVRCDVLADFAVAPRGPSHEASALVPQGNGNAVDLRLAHQDAEPLRFKALGRSLGPCVKLFAVESVVQRQHRRAVLHRREKRRRCRPHPPSRRVAVAVGRRVGFEVFQLSDEPVVVGVGDLRHAVGVVPLVVAGDQQAQLRLPRLYINIHTAIISIEATLAAWLAASSGISRLMPSWPFDTLIPP